MRKRLNFVKEESQRMKEIKRIEKELAELRGKKDQLLRPSKGLTRLKRGRITRARNSPRHQSQRE